MAFRVRLTLRAAQEAESIYRRVAGEAPIHGPEWYQRFIQSIDSLSELPERCAVVDSLSASKSTIRKLLFGKRPHLYRIYFDVVGDTVRVLHIRHGARREPDRHDLFGG